MKYSGPERFNAEEIKRLCGFINHAVDYSTKRLFREVGDDAHLDIVRDGLYSLLSVSITTKATQAQFNQIASLVLHHKPVFKSITSHDLAVFAKMIFKEADFFPFEDRQTALVWTIFQNQLKEIYDLVFNESKKATPSFLKNESYLKAYLGKKFLEFCGQLLRINKEAYPLAFYQFLNLGLVCQDPTFENDMDETAIAVMFAPCLLHGLKMNGTLDQHDLVAEYKFMILVVRSVINQGTLASSEKNFISIIKKHSQPDFESCEKSFKKKYKKLASKAIPHNAMQYAELSIQNPLQEVQQIKEYFYQTEVTFKKKELKNTRLSHDVIEKPPILLSRELKQKLSLDLTKVKRFDEENLETMTQELKQLKLSQ